MKMLITATISVSCQKERMHRKKESDQNYINNLPSSEHKTARAGVLT
jgi:hypothetical protein